MMIRRPLLSGMCATVAGALFVGGAVAGDWGEDVDLPDPQTTEHPGADDAPASSPVTYPDEEGFRERAGIVLEGVADNDLRTWRRGFFEGGDPGKYLPGHAMAKLLIGQDDPDIEELYNDDRSVREHYHFAAVNWGRFYPLFGEDILTEEKQEEFAERAFRYGAYLGGGGTENHVTQWRTTVNVLPYYTGRGLSHQGKEDTLEQGKEWLHNYIKGIFAAGNGEWDSSTYIMYTMNGLQNIYDFSEDPEARLIARAGLDWFATAYALKYRDGIFTAPLQRGFAHRPHGTISDQTGFIWWGSNAEITEDDTRGWRYTLHPITSGWRPNEVITNIARKDLPDLPVEFRNSKPNYWGTTGSPNPSSMHETLYITEHFNLGTLWNGHGSQISRTSLVIDTDEGGVAFHGGHPRRSDHRGQKTGTNHADGNSRYTQFAQSESSQISMSLSPEDEEHQYSYFRMPEGHEVEQYEDSEGRTWMTMTAGEVLVAVYPLSDGDAEAEVVDKDDYRIIRIPGQRSGYILEVLDPTLAEGDSAAALKQHLGDAQIDDSAFAEDMSVSYTGPVGRAIEMTFSPDPDNDRHANRQAEVSIGGEEMTFGDWPVYDGPYVQQAGGVLKVHDGRDGFKIDFTGDLPVYESWSP